MKIMLVTFDPPQNVGGIEGRAISYMKWLRDEGHHVELVSFSRSRGINSNDAIRLSPSPLKMLPSLIRIRNIVKKRGLNNIFMLSGALTLTGLAILLYAKLAGHRVGILLYGKDILVAKKKIWLGNIALQLATRLAYAVFVNSQYTFSLLPTKARNKATVLYPSIDPSIMDSEPIHQKPREPHILFVGRLVKRKGVDDLIKAFSRVRSVRPDAVLDIVGDGPQLQDLRKLASSLGVSRGVNFYGTLRGKDLYRLYSIATVFVLSSKTLSDDVEGFGTVFLEAAYFALPCVGTDSGGIPEAVLNGMTGAIVKESDVDGLSDAILHYLNEPNLAKKHGEAGRERVLRDFRLDNAMQTLIRAFD